MHEASTSVSFTGVMSAVTFFVIAILIPNYREELFLPLFYLFISGFGYVYSTLIYANASGELARIHRKAGEEILKTGNIISEYFGIFHMVFAFPIAFLVLTGIALSVSILAVSIIGFILYHLGGFSILERFLPKSKSQRPLKSLIVISFVISLLMAINYISYVFYSQSPTYFNWVIASTIPLVLSTIFLAAYCLKKREI